MPMVMTTTVRDGLGIVRIDSLNCASLSVGAGISTLAVDREYFSSKRLDSCTVVSRTDLVNVGVLLECGKDAATTAMAKMYYSRE